MTTTQERSAETTAGPAAASSTAACGGVAPSAVGASAAGSSAAASSGAGSSAAGASAARSTASGAVGWAVPGVDLTGGPRPGGASAPAKQAGSSPVQEAGSGSSSAGFMPGDAMTPEAAAVRPDAAGLVRELADLAREGTGPGAGSGAVSGSGSGAGPGGSGGHPVVVAVVACLEALDSVRDTGLGTLRPVEIRLLLIAVVQIIAAAFALKLRLLVAGQVQRVQDLTGATSVAAFVAHLTQTRRPDASAEVRLAHDLDRRFPLIADALARGLMSPEQVRVAVAALRRLPVKELTAEQWTAVQACLVHAARSMNPTQLRAVGRRLWEVIDPEGAERRLSDELEDEEELARAKAHLRFWRNGDGTTGFKGKLPDLQADILIKAVQAFASPRRTNNPNIPTSQPDDHHHHPARPGDSGGESGESGEEPQTTGGAGASTSGAADTAPPEAGHPDGGPPGDGDPPPWRRPGWNPDQGPHRDEDDWSPAERDRGRKIPYPVRLGHGLIDLLERLPREILPTSSGIAATIVVTMTLDQLTTGLGACTLDTGTEVSAGQIRRLACEAGIIPAVLGGESEPLDVGRERRLHTKAQRIAIHLRDGGCPIEGCDRPSAWTHAHHTTAWQDGGPTNVTDGTSPCAYHHQLLHSPKWHATKLPNGKTRLRRVPRS